MEALQLEKKTGHTTEYLTTVQEDQRELANAKLESTYHLEPYQQVFTEKYGFIPNLSILDLIFNEGPNALSYLEQHRDVFKK
jgi:hypothetical protein